MYNLTLQPAARDELRRIPQEDQVRIWRKIHETIVRDPRPRGKNPKRLTGVPLSRLRVGSYRVIYGYDASNVRIEAIRHRKDAYRGL